MKTFILTIVVLLGGQLASAYAQSDFERFLGERAEVADTGTGDTVFGDEQPTLEQRLRILEANIAEIRKMNSRMYEGLSNLYEEKARHDEERRAGTQGDVVASGQPVSRPMTIGERLAILEKNVDGLGRIDVALAEELMEIRALVGRASPAPEDAPKLAPLPGEVVQAIRRIVAGQQDLEGVTDQLEPEYAQALERLVDLRQQRENVVAARRRLMDGPSEFADGFALPYYERRIEYLDTRIDQLKQRIKYRLEVSRGAFASPDRRVQPPRDRGITETNRESYSARVVVRR